MALLIFPGLEESVGITFKPLCNLCELRVSVVDLPRQTLTTETRSSLRMHRENQVSIFPTESETPSLTATRRKHLAPGNRSPADALAVTNTLFSLEPLL